MKQRGNNNLTTRNKCRQHVKCARKWCGLAYHTQPFHPTAPPPPLPQEFIRTPSSATVWQPFSSTRFPVATTCSGLYTERFLNAREKIRSKWGDCACVYVLFLLFVPLLSLCPARKVTATKEHHKTVSSTTRVGFLHSIPKNLGSYVGVK